MVITDLFWARMTIIGPILMLPFMVLFSYYFSGKKKKLSRKKIFLIFLPTIILFPLAFTSLNISDTVHHDWGGEITPGPVYFIFNLYFVLYLGITIRNLFKKFRGASGILKQQLRYILTGITITAFLAIFVSGVLPLFGISRLSIIGPPSTIIFIAFTAYAIVKHRLLDIRLIILRTITYSLVVLLISVTVVGLTLLLPEILAVSLTTKTVISIAVSIFIVLILDPLKRGIAKATDQLFFKARIDYQKLLQELSRIINREIDMDVLLYSLSRKLENRLKIKNVSVYLSGRAGGAYYKRKGRLDANGKKIKGKEEDNNGELDDRLSHDNPLVHFLNERKEIIVLEALERKIEDTQDEAERKKLEQSKKALDALDAAVVAPVMVGNNLNAVLVMGPKLSGDPFGSEDIDLLTLIGPQLASALEKSRLYEEARQFTERLKKEVAVATEGLRNTNLQLQEQNRFLSALQKVTNLITRTLDFHKVTQAITDSITTELGYLGGILLFLGKNKHKLFPDAVTQTKKTQEVLKLLPKPFDSYYGDYRNDKTRSIKAIKLGKVQIGTDFADFISPPIPAEVAKKIQEHLGIKTIIAVPIYSEEGIVGVIDFLLERDPGELKETDLSMMKALCNQTGIVYRNIELYRQLEDSNRDLAEANKHLQQLDQAKSEFVSIASHQLRTPMTGIMGYLSMILQGDFGKVPDEQNKVLQGLLEESQRMIRLINLFLNVSKIESGKLELNKRQVQFEELVEKEAHVVGKAAEDKDLKLVYDKPDKPLPPVMADADKLGDVIMNLTDNAIKYTDEGSITLKTEVDGGMMHFSVHDTGRGIPPEEAKKLFTKFVRGYGIAQVNPDGSGLGLYVARRLTEAHGGKIWVESAGEGKGSTFHVQIPLAKEGGVESKK